MSRGLGIDLTTAPLEGLLAALNAATRLGYADHHERRAPRTGEEIYAAIGLAGGKRGHVMPLRHAYMAGRFHAEVMPPPGPPPPPAPDPWRHRDGTEHSASGPRGCMPCANLRRSAMHPPEE